MRSIGEEIVSVVRDNDVAKADACIDRLGRVIAAEPDRISDAFLCGFAEHQFLNELVFERFAGRWQGHATLERLAAVGRKYAKDWAKS